MKVLSPYDGMACGMLAMQKAGIDVERYVAFEYDELSASEQKGRPYGFAALTASHNFPMIEQRGNVFQADFTEFSGFDFLIGGSPCTYWSIAQKNNRETEASGMGWELFSQYVRALNEAKPKWFIYENNKSMSNAIRESIDKAFGFEAVCINSALVSAQNRQRLYWVGKRNEDGTYSKVHVGQPEDRGILLKDVLESGTAWQGKSFAYTTKCQGATPHDTLGKHRHTMVAEPVACRCRGRVDKDGNGYAKYECREDGKANTLDTNTVNGAMVAEPVPVYATPCEWDENGNPIKAISSADGKTYTIHEVKDGKITIKGKQYSIKLADGFYIIRKLTVSECKRLQTVPEWYEFPVSDSQAYKMLGNGWTVDVIAHILTGLKGGEC